MNIKPFRRSAALAVSVLLTALGAHAAGSFTIQSGNWVVTSELNGAPGRGMAIDVQDSLLVMQVYNYESSGQPTFHMSFGDLQGNHYQGTLKRYKNGRYYGSSPMDAMEDGDDGEVLIDFDSATSGTIQFPGEPAVAISRYKFDNVPDHQLSRVGTSERWLMAEIDANDTPIGALVVNVYTPSPRQTVLSSVRSRLDGDASTATNCTYAAATRQFTCPIDFGGGKTRTLTWSKHLEGMSGTISYLDGNFSPAVVRQRRVIGMRLGIDYGMATVNAQMDVLAAHMAPPFNYPAPDPGNWIVSSELNGKPGRGMAIDVQYDKLVMQVYNYEPSGAATFHMAVADYQRGQATGRLMRYEGGRYYGGPELIGHEAGDAGEVKLDFATPTRGTLQFPGEPAVAIQRYQFGAAAPQPESLLGKWMFFTPDSGSLAYLRLDGISPTQPAATGGFLDICKYTDGETVQCNSDSPVNHDEFHFKPVNGRAIGTHSMSGGPESPVYVLRLKDRHGTLAGLGGAQ